MPWSRRHTGPIDHIVSQLPGTRHERCRRAASGGVQVQAGREASSQKLALGAELDPRRVCRSSVGAVAGGEEGVAGGGREGLQAFAQGDAGHLVDAGRQPVGDEMPNKRPNATGSLADRIATLSPVGTPDRSSARPTRQDSSWTAP
jgi:hypothetical protein